MRDKIYQIIFLIVFCYIGTATSEDKVALSGWVKSRPQIYSSPVKGSKYFIGGDDLINSGRLKLLYDYSESSTFELAYDLSINYHNTREIFFDTSSTKNLFSYRLFDVGDELFSHQYNGQTRVASSQNLDRLLYTLTHEKFDIFIGRQPISFGSARFVNPTDVLVPYNAVSIDKDERRGVDGVRARIPLGEMGEVDSGIVFGDEAKSESNAYFINVKYPIWEVDTAFMAMNFKKNNLFGIDLQGSVLSAGVWLEAAFVDTKEDHEDYLRVSTGVQYSFTSDVSGILEYHYNGAGSKRVENYASNFTKVAYTEGGVYLLAQNYLTLGITYQVSPLVTFSQNITINVDDSTFLLSPKIEWSVDDDQIVDIGAFIGVGKKMSSVINSEFGSYPDSLYIAYRFYF